MDREARARVMALEAEVKEATASEKRALRQEEELQAQNMGFVRANGAAKQTQAALVCCRLGTPSAALVEPRGPWPHTPPHWAGLARGPRDTGLTTFSRQKWAALRLPCLW